MARGHLASQLQPLDSDASLLDSSLPCAVLIGSLWMVALVCPAFGANCGIQRSTAFSPSF